MGGKVAGNFEGKPELVLNLTGEKTEGQPEGHDEFDVFSLYPPISPIFKNIITTHVGAQDKDPALPILGL